MDAQAKTIGITSLRQAVPLSTQGQAYSQGAEQTIGRTTGLHEKASAMGKTNQDFQSWQHKGSVVGAEEQRQLAGHGINLSQSAQVSNMAVGANGKINGLNATENIAGGIKQTQFQADGAGNMTQTSRFTGGGMADGTFKTSDAKAIGQQAFGMDEKSATNWQNKMEGIYGKDGIAKVSASYDGKGNVNAISASGIDKSGLLTADTKFDGANGSLVQGDVRGSNMTGKQALESGMANNLPQSQRGKFNEMMNKHKDTPLTFAGTVGDNGQFSSLQVAHGSNMKDSNSAVYDYSSKTDNREQILRDKEVQSPTSAKELSAVAGISQASATKIFDHYGGGIGSAVKKNDGVHITGVDKNGSQIQALHDSNTGDIIKASGGSGIDIKKDPQAYVAVANAEKYVDTMMANKPISNKELQGFTNADITNVAIAMAKKSDSLLHERQGGSHTEDTQTQSLLSASGGVSGNADAKLGTQTGGKGANSNLGAGAGAKGSVDATGRAQSTSGDSYKRDYSKDPRVEQFTNAIYTAKVNGKDFNGSAEINKAVFAGKSNLAHQEVEAEKGAFVAGMQAVGKNAGKWD
ncbi:MAG: hypothetical protein WCJ49_00580 [Deltaproteobacteria bacterium]